MKSYVHCGLKELVEYEGSMNMNRDEHYFSSNGNKFRPVRDLNP